MFLYSNVDRCGAGSIPTSPENQVRDGMGAIYPRLWRYAVALTGRRDWGDDLAQTTCLRALDKADQFEAGTHLDRWMFRMCQRVWLNEVRARKVRTGAGVMPVEQIDLADTAPGTEVNILARQVLSQVYALPEGHRQSVLLVYVEGFSYKEAAEIMEIPIGTVMSRLAAARKRLNADLADPGGGNA
jgi:RNA polymerase sigma-70 factor (ECF subfamily)